MNYWVSEQDKGIYHAMNKGLKYASGDYCLFLNSGDRFYSDSVVEQFYALRSDADIVLGCTAYVMTNGKISIGRSVTGHNITFLDLYKSKINHQSSFIKRSLLAKYPYDESLRICADWKFYLQSLIIGNATFATADFVVCYFDINGISNQQDSLNVTERRQITNNLFFLYPRMWQDYKEMTIDMRNLSRALAPYPKFAKMIYWVDMACIRTYQTLSRLKKHSPITRTKTGHRKRKVTVITINYNNRDGLGRTVESVVGQTVCDFEYIVIDGGSTDGSVDVIRKYADSIDYWVSEPDRGIYHAMNKGLRYASGDYCLFLNSGDCFYDNRVIELFLSGSCSADLILGRAAIVSRDGRVRIARDEFDEDITFIWLLKHCMIHQALFINVTLMKRLRYDERYHICSDWKFLLMAIINENVSFGLVNIVVSYYHEDGVSATNPSLLYSEKRAILKEMYGLPARVMADFEEMSIPAYRICKSLAAVSPAYKTVVYHINMILFRMYKKIR